MQRTLSEVSRKTVLVLAACLVTAACNNDNFSNSGLISAGARFALVIEPARTSIDGTHFLLDTATGDTWTLKSGDGGAERWVRVAEGPSDVKPLTIKELLGRGRQSSTPSTP